MPCRSNGSHVRRGLAGRSCTATSTTSRACSTRSSPARARGRWRSWARCSAATLTLPRSPATSRPCARDPDTWRLVLVPQEGAPAVLHERIVLGRAAIVRQLAAKLAPGGLDAPDPELAAHLLTAFADEAARLLLADPVATRPSGCSSWRGGSCARYPACDPPDPRVRRARDSGARRSSTSPAVIAFVLRRLVYAAGHGRAHRVLRLRADARAAAGAVPGRAVPLRARGATSSARCCTSTSARRACSSAARRSTGCGSTGCGWTCSCSPAGSSSGSRSASAAALWCAARPRSLASRAIEGAGDVLLLRARLRRRPHAAARLRARLRAAQAPVLLRHQLLQAAAGEPVGLLPHDARAVDRRRAADRGAVPAPHAGDRARHAWGRTTCARRAPRACRRTRVVRRHAGPPTRVAVASLFGASAPIMVTNMVLVEWVFTAARASSATCAARSART